MSPEETPEKQRQQQEEKKGGAGRTLAVGCLVVVALLSVAALVIVLWLKGTWVRTTQEALQKTQAHSEVVEKLGEPLSIGTKAAPGQAKYNVEFPIHGPKGEGTVHLELTGEWEVKKVSVTIKETDERIDIVGTAEDPAASKKKKKRR